MTKVIFNGRRPPLPDPGTKVDPSVKQEFISEDGKVAVIREWVPRDEVVDLEAIDQRIIGLQSEIDRLNGIKDSHLRS